MTDEVLLDAHQVSWGVAATDDTRQTRILDSVSLTVRRGEFVGLVGPNGAGKSSLLRVLIGFTHPSAGTITIGATPLTQLSHRDRARRVAYMSQHGPDQFPFSARDVVEMGAWSRGRGSDPFRRPARASALEALRFVGLADIADRPFPRLSGGEQQLVLFARVLVQDSPLILLDEPTASLDIGHEARLLGMVRELCEEGYAALAALHALNSAAEYCSRVVMLAGGRVVANGSPAAVLTEANVRLHYRTPVHVSRNDSTGSVLVTAVPPAQRAAGYTVHLIGGAGSAVSLTRNLRRLGCTVTGGVAHELDSDARLWHSLGLECVTVPAFADVDQAAFEAALPLVDRADLVVLCDFPFGRGNTANLRLAARAADSGTLAIVDEDPNSPSRAFYAEGVAELFEEVASRAPCSRWESIVDAVQAHAAP